MEVAAEKHAREKCIICNETHFCTERVSSCRQILVFGIMIPLHDTRTLLFYQTDGAQKSSVAYNDRMGTSTSVVVKCVEEEEESAARTRLYRQYEWRKIAVLAKGLKFAAFPQLPLFIVSSKHEHLFTSQNWPLGMENVTFPHRIWYDFNEPILAHYRWRG